MVKCLMMVATACLLLSCVDAEEIGADGTKSNAEPSDSSEQQMAGDMEPMSDANEQPGETDVGGGADQEPADLAMDASRILEEAGVADSSVGPPNDAEIGGDVSVPQSNLSPGLFAEYFAEYRTPVLQRIELAIDHEWGEGQPHPRVPADFFAARWT